MRTRQVHVHIGAIALRNFAAGDRGRIAAGFRTELQQRLADAAGRGEFIHGRTVASLQFPDLRVPSGVSADRWGQIAAEHVAKGIGS